MIDLSREVLLGVGAAIGSVLLAAAKWLVSRAVRQFDRRLDTHEKRLDDYEDRLAAVEMDYVDKETLRLAVGEIKETIDAWGSDMHRGIDTAHTRLDTVYNELLRRSGT